MKKILLSILVVILVSVQLSAGITTTSDFQDNKKTLIQERQFADLTNLLVDKPTHEPRLKRWVKKAVQFAEERVPMLQILHSDDSKNDAKIDGMGTASFVCGLVGLFIAGLILGLLAIVFGAIALNRITRSEGKRTGRGLAIAGLILGVINVFAVLIFLAL